MIFHSYPTSYGNFIRENHTVDPIILEYPARYNRFNVIVHYTRVAYLTGQF